MTRHLCITILLLSALSLQARVHKSSYYLEYAERFASTQILNDPQLCMADGVKKPKWDYTQGLVARAMLEAYRATGSEAYLNYVREFADFFIAEDGSILTYKLRDYNIDRVNGGTFLYLMQEVEPQERYLKAIDTLYSQLLTHPRTSEGGFWHKKIYPHQMWLDGLYMGQPFYCHYARANHIDSIYADVERQFLTVDKHTFDPATGLNYHGWDESHEQRWADSITGCSPNFWARSMGWYVMAMVDVLDYLPEGSQEQQTLLQMLRRTAGNLLRWQDKRSHLWYQLMVLPKEEGNYLEATSSAIFCYAFAKAANRGYLPACYKREAARIFDGLIRYSTHTEGNKLHLDNCCKVAGLGGNPYRDGTIGYYLGEPVISDDPKGVGPMIMAAVELSKARNRR